MTTHTYEIDLQNNAELADARARGVLAGINSFAPKTLTEYVPKQQEFKEWCIAKQYADGILVTPDKLLVYLSTYIIPRGSRIGHRKKNRDEPQEHIPLSHGGIEKYICAIICLYREQVALGLNKAENPRGMGLKGLMSSCPHIRHIYN